MKVVILCGGMGARLREETEFRPKPMVKIGGRPILWHIMKIYSYYGYDEFVLCLGYRGDVIKEYFYHYMLHSSDVTVRLGQDRHLEIHDVSRGENWTVTLADTGEHDLKGARIKKIEKYIEGDSFMLTYGDGLCDVDLDALIEFHQTHGKIATVTGVSPRSSYGQIRERDGRVTEFNEKPQISEGVINGGFFVFQRQLFDYLTVDPQCDFEIGPLEQLTREEQLMVYRHKGNWASMDTYRDTTDLNRLWDENQVFWRMWQ
jgi:glucose-1-phosphate cytidylyltransferase